MERSAGVLLHISSLPSKWGIGTLGKEAYKFVDFLSSSGQSYWQMLPIGPTSFGDSPYQSLSMYAGNPYFIDLDMLEDDGLLCEEDYKYIDWGSNETKVDFGKLYENRLQVLCKAYVNASKKKIENFDRFKKDQKSWLYEYSLFMAIKEVFHGMPWTEWPDDIKFRKSNAINHYQDTLKDEINFWCFIQYLFFQQWSKLKTYANSKGIKLIGDIPIYVAMDSVDVWSNPQVFWLDKSLTPVCVAGCPPDSFSPTGQLWGNPLYDWKHLKQSNYKWWLNRIEYISKLFDVTRIDHFRGFESYYAVPYNEKTAINGSWKKCPGSDFFKTVKEKLGHVNIIAEDLGFVSDEVKQLLTETGFPGMKVLLFAFDSGPKNSYLPHMYERNCVVYTGTHDNDTVAGWLEKSPKQEKDYAISYCHMVQGELYTFSLIRIAYESIANLVIIPMQDFLGLGSFARMNTPSTLGNNWQWRMEDNMLSKELKEKILALTKTYDRFLESSDKE